MSAPLAVEATPGSKLIDIVREQVRDHGLPLYWRCGQGTCGACLVRLKHTQSGLARPITLSSKERNVLHRLGQFDDTQRATTDHPDTPALPRLACHVVVDEEDLEVNW
ncbi:2Fe-2S iron-sulfur cluster-binding protein [Parachitinimonas caeni]|uniref:2Fe-2S iron-sulfur cluster-binding protein n=1 Tax=Parachitinimonas caeni TaxID=3031301 RepID=A0ABT7DVM3_9NEIS|nr:2Fe-2S iron-sulfur cluster-binding protein [Parachitinimonas caeni]MDK2123205.1 2Fe-2S iron-sulfur cluster-binding protein [Parachitinimonas caeni]